MAEVRQFGLMCFNFKMNEIGFCYWKRARKFITKLRKYQYDVIRTDEFG